MILRFCLIIAASFSVAPFVYASEGLSATAIVNEYNEVRDKRIAGYFGEAGIDVIKAHEKNIANYLATKLKAKECRDIQKLIPSLDTGYYIFRENKATEPTIPLMTTVSSTTDSVFSLFNQVNEIIGEVFGVVRERSPPKLVAKRCISYSTLVMITTM